MERSKILPSPSKNKQPKCPLKVSYDCRFLHILQAFGNHPMSSIEAMYLIVWWYPLPFTKGFLACSYIIAAA